MPSFTAQQTYVMLENQSLWQTADQVYKLLVENGIDYAIWWRRRLSSWIPAEHSRFGFTDSARAV